MTSMRATLFKQAGWTAFIALFFPVLAVIKVAGQSADAGSTFDNLEIVDTTLNAKVAVLRVGSQLADNNLLTVFAGLKNKTERRVALEVETIYKDKAGNTLNSGSWIPLTLDAHEEKDYRSTAISVDAVDFLIRVRRAVKPVVPAHT